jgi:hypothetical protein
MDPMIVKVPFLIILELLLPVVARDQSLPLKKSASS